MELFHRIDNAQAIVRLKGGVFKQAELYHRGEAVYVKASGGFVKLAAAWDGKWGTSSPSVNVVDIQQDVPGLFVYPEGKGKVPKYIGGKKP